jgi:hypothetical protein
MNKPVATVVDYEAWNRGYMPPSEHILIDQLSYRGAKVIMSTDLGDNAWWFVIRGKRPSKENMRKIFDLLAEIDLDEIDDAVSAKEG